MKIKFTLTLLCVVAIISLSFRDNTIKRYHYFRSSGAAASFGSGWTGASFDNGGASCGNCHNGGGFSPSITVALLNASNNPVTSYTLGESYTLSIVINSLTGAPDAYGFQLMCVKQSDNSNINNWGATLPIAVQNTLTGSSRNYIEHSSPLVSGTINIPWTAPTTAMGTVRFFAVGNAVNGDGGTGGDNAVNASLTISQSVLPVTFVSFSGVEFNRAAKLNWLTSQELNNAYFNIEHSIDGSNFNSIGNVAGQGNSSNGFNYEFVHKQPFSGKNFYRLKQVDVDGSFKYSNTTVVKVANKKVVEIYPNPVLDKLMLRSTINLNTNKYRIINQTGAEVAAGIINGNEINVSQLVKGNYYLTLIDKNEVSISIKFVKQ